MKLTKKQMKLLFPNYKMVVRFYAGALLEVLVLKEITEDGNCLVILHDMHSENLLFQKVFPSFKEAFDFARHQVQEIRKAKMRLKTDFIVISLFGLNFIRRRQFSVNNFYRMILISKMPASIWNLLGNKDFTLESVAALMQTQFQYGTAHALSEASCIVDKWVSRNLIER